jgi:hypothetical protein
MQTNHPHFSMHCNSYGGHLHAGSMRIIWRNALPANTPVYGNGIELLYHRFGEFHMHIGSRSFSCGRK